MCTTSAAMELPNSAAGIATPKNLIGLSVVFLLAAAVLGVMNGQKAHTLRTAALNAEASRDAIEKKRLDEQKDIKAREAAATQAATKAAEAETIANKIQSDLAQLQAEKADLQTKLQAAQAEVATIQHQINPAAGTTAPDGANPGAASPTELQAQLDEARKQLENAERENVFLSEKIKGTQEKADQINQERKRRQTAVGRAGIRGTILAVNQAYNFVVLNLGGRQGVEPNAEMLVMRDGTLIGRIRISSVEPSTAIGDVVTNSLERGVQVQPGDIVVYAGSNS
jgi:cob(I)alamin adenosyltransferase